MGKKRKLSALTPLRSPALRLTYYEEGGTMPNATVTIRVPDDILARLPPASLTGERTAFILSAIKEKLEREAD